MSKVGVLSLVLLSVLEEPESLVNLKSGALGGAGGVVSIICNAPVATSVAPKLSVTVRRTV